MHIECAHARRWARAQGVRRVLTGCHVGIDTGVGVPVDATIRATDVDGSNARATSACNAIDEDGESCCSAVAQITGTLAKKSHAQHPPKLVPVSVKLLAGAPPPLQYPFGEIAVSVAFS